MQIKKDNKNSLNAGGRCGSSSGVQNTKFSMYDSSLYDMEVINRTLPEVKDELLKMYREEVVDDAMGRFYHHIFIIGGCRLDPGTFFDAVRVFLAGDGAKGYASIGVSVCDNPDTQRVILIIANRDFHVVVEGSNNVMYSNAGEKLAVNGRFLCNMTAEDRAAALGATSGSQRATEQLRDEDDDYRKRNSAELVALSNSRYSEEERVALEAKREAVRLAVEAEEEESRLYEQARLDRQQALRDAEAMEERRAEIERERREARERELLLEEKVRVEREREAARIAQEALDEQLAREYERLSVVCDAGAVAIGAGDVVQDQPVVDVAGICADASIAVERSRAYRRRSEQELTTIAQNILQDPRILQSTVVNGRGILSVLGANVVMSRDVTLGKIAYADGGRFWGDFVADSENTGGKMYVGGVVVDLKPEKVLGDVKKEGRLISTNLTKLIAAHNNVVRTQAFMTEFHYDVSGIVGEVIVEDHRMVSASPGFESVTAGMLGSDYCWCSENGRWTCEKGRLITTRLLDSYPFFHYDVAASVLSMLEREMYGGMTLFEWKRGDEWTVKDAVVVVPDARVCSVWSMYPIARFQYADVLKRLKRYDNVFFDGWEKTTVEMFVLLVCALRPKRMWVRLSDALRDKLIKHGIVVGDGV